MTKQRTQENAAARQKIIAAIETLLGRETVASFHWRSPSQLANLAFDAIAEVLGRGEVERSAFNPIAVRWALSVEVEKASDRLVLVALATTADAEWMSWPTREAIQAITRQDVKTITDATRRLKARGLISDTGERRGASGRVAIVQLHPNLGAAP